MIAGESACEGLAGGKSEHHTAACRVKHAGTTVKNCGDGECHRKNTAGSLATKHG
jgi:hypothetical protein